MDISDELVLPGRVLGPSMIKLLARLVARKIDTIGNLNKHEGVIRAQLEWIDQEIINLRSRPGDGNNGTEETMCKIILQRIADHE